MKLTGHGEGLADKINYPRTAWRLKRFVKADLDRLLADLRQRCNRGLHMGAGRKKLPGLINCDYYNPDADMKVDAADLSVFKAGSIDLIESHHMIEHLSFAAATAALKEWRRVLCDGGVLVLTFPDITRICLQWLKYWALFPIFPRPDKQDYILRMMVGSQEHSGMFHKSAYDTRRMEKLLAQVGLCVNFSYTPYPDRPTPSTLIIARKKG